jgi:hypothetical protein
MMPTRKQLTVLTFKGPRFEDHGLDVEVLPEISAYKRLLQESAKEIWRRKHPGRIRLPKGFEADIHLKFFALEAGSTAIPLFRELAATPEPHLMSLDDELDEAAVVLEEAIRAAGEHESVPSTLPRSVIPLFEELGKTLHEDEHLLLATRKWERPVRYDSQVKQWILGWASTSYDDMVDLTGEVRATDLDGLKFTLRLEDGERVIGRFKPEHEAVLLEALGEHTSRRMRVVGVGQFAPEDGTLKQVVEVERIEVVEPSTVASEEVPIWERLASIGATAPDDVWETIPTDLSANVDHYLYGGKKDRH